MPRFICLDLINYADGAETFLDSDDITSVVTAAGRESDFLKASLFIGPGDYLFPRSSVVDAPSSSKVSPQLPHVAVAILYPAALPLPHACGPLSSTCLLPHADFDEASRRL